MVDLSSRARAAGVRSVSILLLLASGLFDGAVRADLVAHWSMDRATTEILESDIGGLDGTLVGFPGTADKWIQGVLGQALLFDGIDDHVTHPFDLPRVAGTIGHWLRSDDVANKIALYWSDSPAGATDYNGFGAVGDAFEVHTGVRDTGVSIAGYQDGEGIDNAAGGGRWRAEGGVLSGWTHVATTWDRSGDLVLYLNCEEIDREPLSSGVFADHATSERYIGRPSEAIRWWKGAIDEIRIYDEALDADAVRRAFCPTRIEEAAVVVPDSPGNNDGFGISAALAGDTLVVGQPLRPGGGSIQIFDRAGPGSAWSFVAERAASSTYSGLLLGNDVALSGDYAIATGAGEVEGEDLLASVFERNLGGADAWGVGLEFSKDGDDTGTQLFVDLDGSTAAILNRSGFAYLYRRTAPGSWSRVTRIAPDGDSFTSGIAISGDALAVATVGGVEIHRRDLGGADAWGLERIVDAPAGVSFWAADGALDLRGDTLVVGAPGEGTFTGAAYVFSRHRGGTDQWGLVQRLEADDADPWDRFGRSVSLASENAVLLGTLAQKADHGAGYLFTRDGTGWSQRAVLLSALFQGRSDEFGFAVAADRESALVGAPRATMVQGRMSDYSLAGLAGWPLFVDDFEAGDASAWSAEAP